MVKRISVRQTWSEYHTDRPTTAAPRRHSAGTGSLPGNPDGTGAGDGDVRTFVEQVDGPDSLPGNPR